MYRGRVRDDTCEAWIVQKKVAALRAKLPPNELSKKKVKVITCIHEGATKWDPEITTDGTIGFDLKTRALRRS